jgi:hypothetical protein
MFWISEDMCMSSLSIWHLIPGDIYNQSIATDIDEHVSSSYQGFSTKTIIENSENRMHQTVWTS